MNRYYNFILIIFLMIVLVTGCSHPDPNRLMRDRNPKDPVQADKTYDSEIQTDNDTADNNGSDQGVGENGNDSFYFNHIIDQAEYHYARGVKYFHESKSDSAQSQYEQALYVLSELDINPDENPDQALRIETILNEIEQDYRLTLMSSGVLYSEDSVIAFRDLFDDLKNFKKLKESGAFRSFVKSDEVTYSIPPVMNERVENALAYLQTTSHKSFAKWLNRSGKYLPMVERIIKEEGGIPEDIKYLPYIESGYNPHAYSSARAVGMWQFISSTGRMYGLDNDWWQDERRDFEKSTRAAIRHLKDLYKRFGTWELALAAYNTGAGRVSREIRKKKTDDYWNLRLPRETRNYVPLFMAATIICKQPEKYGFNPKFDKPLEWEFVTTSRCISFNNISAKSGIPVSDLEMLNPELRRGITPPNTKSYKLRIPIGYTDKFLASYDKIPSEKTTSWAKHKIRRGETVSTIARKYGISQSAVVSANKLGRRKRIYAGKTLMIPLPAGSGYAAKGGSSKSSGSKVVASNNGNYRVRRGDTLWEIAEAHNITIKNLKSANRLSSNKIYAGRILKIPGGKNARSSSKSSISNGKFVKYTVRKGDNLWKIASKFSTSISNLKRVNSLTSNSIYPGTKLMVPDNGSSGARSAGGDYSWYTIRKGDSLWKIAKKYDITINQLASWNNIRSNSRLYPGKKLKIY